MSSLSHALSSLVGELIAPSRCAACDERVRANVLFCRPCALSVERIDERRSIRRCDAIFEYGGAIATAVMRFKYEDRPDLGPRFAAMMLADRRSLDPGIDRIVPVPLHPRRLAERGYNQAALLARPLARAYERAFVAPALERVRDTRAQATLDRAERLFNMREAFVARPPLVDGAHVLLVDDVQTTGATLAACTDALRTAGARAVSALVLARREPTCR